MEASLHQEFALALADEFYGARRGGMAVRRIDDWMRADVEIAFGAVARILASGPTRVGVINSAAAASSAPRKDVSSQGCATIVGTGGYCRVAAINRSYLDIGASANFGLRNCVVSLCRTCQTRASL